MRKLSILIIGATQDKGMLAAIHFCKKGAKVVIHGDNLSFLEKAILFIKSQVPYCNISSICSDLRTQEGCSYIISKIPCIDILINNLNIPINSYYDEIDSHKEIELYNLNVMSSVRLSQHYLSHMVENNWGKIIFISNNLNANDLEYNYYYKNLNKIKDSIAKCISRLLEGTNVSINTKPIELYI